MDEIYHLQYRTGLGVWRSCAIDPLHVLPGESFDSLIAWCSKLIARSSRLHRRRQWRLVNAAGRLAYEWTAEALSDSHSPRTVKR